MKSLCFDRLPMGWEAELERWRTSVHTVGRCFTDCRQRCSPNQNLARKKESVSLHESWVAETDTHWPITVHSCKTHNTDNSSPHPSSHQLSQVLLLTAISQLWQATVRRQTPSPTTDSFVHLHLYCVLTTLCSVSCKDILLWLVSLFDVDLLQLLKPRDDALHIIVDGLFNVIQYGLIYREREKAHLGFYLQQRVKGVSSF